MTKRKKRRYYDAYEAVKSHQHSTSLVTDVISSWEIRDLVLDNRDHLLNKRQRGRIGHVERRKKR